MRNVASNVQEVVIGGAGHWLMEERPTETVALIRKFLGEQVGNFIRRCGHRLMNGPSALKIRMGRGFLRLQTAPAAR